MSLTPEGGSAGATITDGWFNVANLKPGKYHVNIAPDPDSPVILRNSPEVNRSCSLRRSAA